MSNYNLGITCSGSGFNTSSIKFPHALRTVLGPIPAIFGYKPVFILVISSSQPNNWCRTV